MDILQTVGDRKVKTKSLYERLGGIYGIAQVVDRFSDALIHNPVVGVDSDNPELSDWHQNQLHRLPGLKWLRTLWVADITGGPYTFRKSELPTDRNRLNLKQPHCPFKISPAEFDAVAGELKKTLQKMGVGSKEQGEVLAAFAAHKGEVTACFGRNPHNSY